MHLRAIIIDDEETGIEILKLLIEKHLPDLKVVGQATHAKKGIELLKDYSPEIVFLDINMPEMDGFEMLEKLNREKFHIIFTTAHQEYALRALKLNAKDYLLKPIDYNDLVLAVNRIREEIDSQKKNSLLEYALLNNINPAPSQKIALTSKHGVDFIDPAEILFLESKSNYTLVKFTRAEAILTPKTLREFEQQLCNNSHFMRVHNSFIINLHKVARYLKEEDCIVMLNLQKVPVSKSRRGQFMQWMTA